MEGDNTPAIRPFVSVADWYRSVAARLDTTFLKRVGVVTYFGVYAAIALGGREILNEATGTLPAAVRPPALAPLHVTLGLPRSFAWGLVSFTATLAVLGVLVAVSLSRGDRADRDRPARLGGRSLVGILAPAARARSIRRRVRSAGRRLRDAVPESPRPPDGDRHSPSTDGGATVDLDASGSAGSTSDDEESDEAHAPGSTGAPTGNDPLPNETVGSDPAEGEPTEGEPAADPLNPFGGDVPVETVDAFDDAEVLTGDEPTADERQGADDEPGVGTDDERVIDSGDEPVTTPDEPVTDDVVDASDASDSPDESAPWPEEAAAESEGAESEVDESEAADAETDDEEPSADAAWPGDWVSGDEL